MTAAVEEAFFDCLPVGVLVAAEFSEVAFRKVDVFGGHGWVPK